MLPRLMVKSLPGPILIVAPHPDDEVLGVGGLIQRALSIGKKVHVLFTTAGDANDQSITDFFHAELEPSWFVKLGDVRHQEALTGDGFLGLKNEFLHFLGFPDSGLWNIVSDRDLSRVHPSPTTKLAEAAYPFAYHQYAPYTHESLLRLVVHVLTQIHPGTVFLPSELDDNLDHRASFLIVREALTRVQQTPALYTYLIHYPNYPGPPGPLVPPADFDTDNCVNLPLTAKQTAKIRKAFTLMPSQSSLGSYYYDWIRRNEWFCRCSPK